MKNLLIYFVAVLFASACAKKETITPEVVEMIPPVAKNNSIREKIDTQPTNTDIIEIEGVNRGKSNGIQDDIEAEVEQVNDESTTLSKTQTSVAKEMDYDQLFPDSVWTEYMTKHGDYLSLIAYNEYQNANEWRRIYEWNKKYWEERGIGPDKDNPNFIYPYRELDLKKPAEDAIEWAYDHYIHVVDDGETLWSIAKQEYGDELAWVVLFWDNDKLLDSHDGKILPGMELKIRSELWPELD